MPIAVRDLSRLDPKSVKLWNGNRWTQLRGMSKSARKGDEIELVLRSGEKISCTPTHRFPTKRGLLAASDIKVGDTLVRVNIPQPNSPKDCQIDEDAAWLAGLYVAEGSRSDDTIQIAGHAKESARWERCQMIARKFGGSATITVDGNKASIRMYGKVLNALIDELVSGRVAKDKCFATVVWRYSNRFLESLMDGYLSGDGHFDPKNDRVRLGFTRNYNLERDLRTACARLGWTLTLNASAVSYDGRLMPTFRGEIRKKRSGHGNQCSREEVVEIRKARCRNVYDLGVADEPHVFALASGILTHNSKPNPMPESVTDRCTKAHEYIFLLSKRPRYYYDAEAVKEKLSGEPHAPGNNKLDASRNDQDRMTAIWGADGFRNLRSVWSLSSESFSGAHFATFPTKLVEPCVKAGTSAKGCCPACGSPWKRVLTKERKPTRPGVNTKCLPHSDGDTTTAETMGWNRPMVIGNRDPQRHCTVTETTGWEPTCECPPHEPVPCLVLDPFSGAGTTGLVALRHGRRYLGVELNPAYADMSRKRIIDANPLFNGYAQEVP